MTKIRKPPHKPVPGEASLRWNGSHQNSALQKASPKQKQAAKRRMAQAREDEKAMDSWARGGFTSHGLHQSAVRNDLGDRA
jgi:hypothetical protein